MNAWKGAALTLIFLMLTVLLFNTFGPAQSKKHEHDGNDAATQQYEEYVAEAAKKNDTYYRKAEDALKRANAVNDLSLSNQERFAKLLARWEQQADQMDRVLSRLEKNK